MSIQARPTKALQWTLAWLFALYFLTFVNEFRYINIKLAVKITDRTIIRGCTTQGASDFTAPHYTVPRPTYQCSMNSPGTGFSNPVSGRYVSGLVEETFGFRQRSTNLAGCRLQPGAAASSRFATI